MFRGEVNMWRSIVPGMMIRKAQKLSTWATHQTWCQVPTPAVPSTSVASG